MQVLVLAHMLGVTDNAFCGRARRANVPIRLGYGEISQGKRNHLGGSMSQTKPKRPVASAIGRPLLAGAIATVAAAPVTAIADIFLALENQSGGIEIKGESVDAKHKDQINILSYTQSFKNTVPTAGAAGKVTCGDITVLKNIDKSSSELIKAVVTGKHFDKAVISFRTTGKAFADYYIVTLGDIFITSIDQTDQPDPAKIVERVSISAANFDFKYQQQAPTGAPVGAATHFTFNCNEQKAQ
jgi:type VI secretion system secreted protein Hcp